MGFEPSALISDLRRAGVVFAEEEARLLLAEARSRSELAHMAQRRIRGEPLEHILGWVAFYERRIQVGEGVFVPRRRTEALAREALAAAPVGGLVVELCCGCAAVAAVLLDERPDLTVHACDIDPAALTWARRNVGPPRGFVHHGDLYDALPDALLGRVDVLVANAPYVPTAEIALMPAEARVHEPRVALDGGADGLVVQRRVLAGAPPWLAPDASVLIETSRPQAPALGEAARRLGWRVTVVHDEDLDASVLVAHDAPTAP